VQDDKDKAQEADEEVGVLNVSHAVECKCLWQPQIHQLYTPHTLQVHHHVFAFAK
jgi:hypothetical protein